MYKLFGKRFIDFALSLSAFIVLSPFLFIVAICLKVANKGAGVFFLQERPGYKGKIFRVIKFKTMTDECDEEGNLLPNEQRITKIGQLLRATSIDELPQLVNVIKGDMSLIGPRPLPVRYLELYSKEQARRHDVKPGISGWAQVNGRNTISWNKKFCLDVWYVDSVSFLLDCKIIYMTIISIICRKDINASDSSVGGTSFNGNN